MQITSNNLSVHYDTCGEGVPLVFVHGFPLNRKMWKPQLSGLSDIAHIIAPDLRGHGDSESTPGPYSMDLFAHDINSLLNALEIDEQIVLCGLSMGGYISLAFYKLFPERLAGLILTATRAAGDSSEGRAARDDAVKRAQQEGVEGVVNGMLPKLLAKNTQLNKPELVSLIRNMINSISVSTMVTDLIAMKERPDSTQILGKIQVPTIIIHGADDQIIPVQEAEVMASAIPGARLKVLPDAGHLVNLEQPVLFNHNLHRFLIEGIK